MPDRFCNGMKIYRIWVSFPLENGFLGMIFISDRYRNATVLKVIRYVSDRFYSVTQRDVLAKVGKISHLHENENNVKVKVKATKCLVLQTRKGCSTLQEVHGMSTTKSFQSYMEGISF